ncbi:hypothetical protein HWV00_17080 [Moritella sp. 24]|uniref:hypothetical protein n=1 Tax=Moritella sp. 24 TaxID=2746230 RepID=UPI001BABF172|nr:hypothetical protein [Moritella sp. 24]QUM77798.1 hypothetical protein HWV00_17080 [Moritella sp. 24]
MGKQLSYFIASFILFSFSALSSEVPSSISLNLTSNNETRSCVFFDGSAEQRKLIMKSITMTKQKNNRYQCLAQLPEDKFKYCTLTGIDFSKGQGLCNAIAQEKRIILDVSATQGSIDCSFICF